MMRSLYSGVAGLQNHQVRMDVLGNNIANVNTTGFKKGRVNFQDLLYQSMSGAARPNTEVGGVNPKEIGLGMLVASVDTIHTQGSLQSTGVTTDVAMMGNGFFILKQGEKELYTRNGGFSLDENGTLVNPANGMRVQGWMSQRIGTEDIINVSKNPGDLVIPMGRKEPARATTQVDYACNLDKRTAEIPADANEATVRKNTWETDFDIYDSYGSKHILRVAYARVPGTNNEWTGTVAVDPEAQVPTAAQLTLNGQPMEGQNFNLKFDNNGLLQGVRAGDNNITTNELVTVGVNFLVTSSDPDVATGAPYRQDFNINLGTVGSTVNTVTQFSSSSTTKAFRQDGNTMGYLDAFKIDQSGIITGVYSNGVNKAIGQIAVASFTNPGGLEKNGENTYSKSNNSGLANISQALTAGKGKIIGGTLEMSNVDLAEQFTDMIVTQRGFQANSKTIQTSDQMLQELLTLKR
jgi:flagellar hook protein FlgE